MQSAPILYYVYDPMCSWCWGYQPVWQKVKQQLSGTVSVQYVVGGLAPDSDEPMPMAMREQIASYWRKIENLLGTPFNYDFWTSNTPRRSTYPACRAALAARKQDAELVMINAIQRAYYLEAKNPSDDEVLLALANQVGLDMTRFEEDYRSAQLNQSLLDEIGFSRQIGANGFPSLVLRIEDHVYPIAVDYRDAHNTVTLVRSVLEGQS
ncbi:DsbA family protein [Vibrio scophthalmi]|uniref:DsbA family protein n=1 Tax=Vibrio scophthalmi TaxID=45658 RepID=UPI002FEF0BF1